MTPLQKHLIQASWKIITPLSCTLGTLFNYRLFDLAPDTRSLFSTAINTQDEKFVMMLDMVIQSLHELDQLSLQLTSLAQRHQRLNITETDYQMVRQALLWTLATALEENWSLELEKAWGMVYDELAEIMQNNTKGKAA